MSFQIQGGVLQKNKEVAQVKKAEKISISLELRAQGHNVKEIAQQMACSQASVRNYINEGMEILAATNLELADKYRHLQFQRIEEQLKVWRPVSMKVDEPEISLPALDRVMRLEAQLMKLMGTEGGPSKEDNGNNQSFVGIAFIAPPDFKPPEDMTLAPKAIDAVQDEDGTYTTEGSADE